MSKFTENFKEKLKDVNSNCLPNSSGNYLNWNNQICFGRQYPNVPSFYGGNAIQQNTNSVPQFWYLNMLEYNGGCNTPSLTSACNTPDVSVCTNGDFQNPIIIIDDCTTFSNTACCRCNRGCLRTRWDTSTKLDCCLGTLNDPQNCAPDWSSLNYISNTCDDVMSTYCLSPTGLNDPQCQSYCKEIVPAGDGSNLLKRRTDDESSFCNNFAMNYCKQGKLIATDPWCYESIMTPSDQRPNETKGGPTWADIYVPQFCANNKGNDAYSDFCSCVNNNLPQEYCVDPQCQKSGYKTASILAQNCAGMCLSIFNGEYNNGTIVYNGNQINQACTILGATGTAVTYSCVNGKCTQSTEGKWVNDPECKICDSTGNNCYPSCSPSGSPSPSLTYNCNQNDNICKPVTDGSGKFTDFNVCNASCGSSSPPSGLKWWEILLIVLGSLIFIGLIIWFLYYLVSKSSPSSTSKTNKTK